MLIQLEEKFEVIMESLYENLIKYCESDYYPFHMPGHKRNQEFLPKELGYRTDITEIDGFDNLHDAEGILKKAMERTAKVFKADESYFLVNGSTCGLLAGISACTEYGDKILMARNCHKSVYHGVFLKKLQSIYVYPHFLSKMGINGGISADNIEKMLITYSDIKLVVLPSPTYEGIVSDIKAIGQICHKYQVPLMVDEAHGAHFGFSNGFPKSASQLGADLIIESVHKTLPSFTQTALLHINGTLVDREKIKKYLSIYQTSSPSYVFMGGMDYLTGLLKNKGDKLFYEYQKKLDNFYREMRKLKRLYVLIKEETNLYFDIDSSKIVIFTNRTNLSGTDLYQILLKKYHLQMEMASSHYVIAMTSICDTQEGFKRLEGALLEIDSNIETYTLENSYKKRNKLEGMSILKDKIEINGVAQQQVITIYEAEQVNGENVLITEGVGRISKEYIYLYPPGIPLIAPGEKITKELLELLKEYKNYGLEIKGLQDRKKESICVVEN